jgi:hypothetical protein
VRPSFAFVNGQDTDSSVILKAIYWHMLKPIKHTISAVFSPLLENGSPPAGPVIRMKLAMTFANGHS